MPSRRYTAEQIVAKLREAGKLQGQGLTIPAVWAFLVRRHKVSERRACRVVGEHRSMQRYATVPGDFEQRLV